jgi:hypothetical protein
LGASGELKAGAASSSRVAFYAGHLHLYPSAYHPNIRWLPILFSSFNYQLCDSEQPEETGCLRGRLKGCCGDPERSHLRLRTSTRGLGDGTCASDPRANFTRTSCSSQKKWCAALRRASKEHEYVEKGRGAWDTAFIYIRWGSIFDLLDALAIMRSTLN